MNTSNLTLLSLIAIFTLVAAISDARTRRLPNWLTVPACLLGIAFHVATGGLAGLITAFSGFAVGFGVLLILWLIGGGGGGDVKLMGALGAWLGPVPIIIVFVLSTVFTAIITVAMAVIQFLRHGLMHVRKKYLPDEARLGARAGKGSRERRRVMPYAIPVALATWSFVAWKIVAWKLLEVGPTLN